MPPEVRHPGELRPGVVGAYAVTRQRHGQQLMNQHRPRAIGDIDGLDPTAARELDEGGRLQHGLGGLAEGGVGGLSCAAASAAHALQKRADGVSNT